MSSRVFAPKASIQRVKRPAERIYGIGATPPRLIRSPSPALVRPPPQPQKQGSTPCKNCGSTETEEGDGNIVCKGCGLVLSNAPNYTSDITFEEGSNGRIQQQGQRVADGQTHQKAFAPRGLGGGPGHEATPAGDKAKTEATGVIRRFAMLLRIDEREVNIGRRIFEMAYNRGFVRGRTIESVAIVSLYIATRRAKDRTPLYDIMLIDLAEQANINVFDLGKMMQDLIKKLYLNPDGSMSKDDHFYLQAHGAEVLIDKFVNHLDFGTDANKIKTDATRILQRMKRDWIHHGRRPSGVCGAAVILAARMNNFRRTLREVVLVAKVTEITVSKRLEEFKETASSNLSVNEFRDDGILGSISEMDPPAFYRPLLPTKTKGKRGRPRKTAPETAAEIEGSDTSSQADTTDDDASVTGEPPAKRPRLDADGFVVPEIPVRSTQPSPSSRNTNVAPPQQDRPDALASQPAKRGPGRLKGSKNWKAPPPTPEEIAYEAELTSSMQAALDDNEDLSTISQLPTPAATQSSSSSSQETISSGSLLTSTPEDNENQTSDPQAATQKPSLPLRIDPKECDPKKGPPGPAVNTNNGNTNTISLDPTILESEFDSDPEVSTCLLSEAERVLKEKIWVTENADWLLQDHAKKIKRELKDRHLREQGIDPDELRNAAKKGENNLRKRKDGARRSGRIGDVSYLKDDFHKRSIDKDTTTSLDNTAGDEGTGQNGVRRPSTASLNVKAMMKQRGTYSRRINYDNLTKAYEFPAGSSTSPSQSSSVISDRNEREGSIISISSTGTASDGGLGSSSIGPIFSAPRRVRGPKGMKSLSQNKDRLRSIRTDRDTRSTSAGDGSATPEAEVLNKSDQEDEAEEAGDSTRQRDSSAASPEPVPQAARQQKERSAQEADNAAHSGDRSRSSSDSPLSSTHSPLGVSTPGSTSGTTTTGPPRLERSMYGNLGKTATATSSRGQTKQADDNDDEDDEDNEDNEEDEDDDEDDEEEDDPEDELEDAFAGNLTERPVWEGEDEVVED